MKSFKMLVDRDRFMVGYNLAQWGLGFDTAWQYGKPLFVSFRLGPLFLEFVA